MGGGLYKGGGVDGQYPSTSKKLHYKNNLKTVNYLKKIFEPQCVSHTDSLKVVPSRITLSISNDVLKKFFK